MNAVLIATIAGIVTAACWGTSDWLSARNTKNISPIQINFVMQVVSTAMMAVLFLFSGVHIDHIEQLVRIGVSSTLITAAFLIFVKALSRGAVGIIVPLGNIYPLFTVLLSVIFLKTDFSFGQLGAMVGIVIGALLLAHEKNTKKLPFRQLHKQTELALLAAVIWGFAFFIASPVVGEVSWQTISILGEPFSLLLAAITMVYASRGNTIVAAKEALTVKPALVAGVFGMTGAMALYFGSGYTGNILIPTVLSAGGPLVASLWGAVFDHEKIGVLKRAGAVVVVAGIVVLNVA